MRKQTNTRQEGPPDLFAVELVFRPERATLRVEQHQVRHVSHGSGADEVFYGAHSLILALAVLVLPAEFKDPRGHQAEKV